MPVTRFAPSPTGYLHIGGARTALFNWFLARKLGGKFILRIEDTDMKRNTPAATEQVISDLKWLNIHWDEGPETGGPNGPYFQSQRLDIYRQYVAKLMDDGRAYYCFETADELSVMREEAITAGKTFKYQRPAELPTEADAAEARRQGRDVVVRFKMPDKTIIVNDLIRGSVKFEPETMGDFVIIKSDGFPTYHFACVVDDELMEVTHVIRGQEHLMNTPYHIALQEALGFRTPEYAHMALVVNPDGSKMSKRDKEKALKEGRIPPEIDINDFRLAGYLPEALVNFISLLGFNPGGKQEIMPVDDMVAAFEINKMGKTNCSFDRKKLIAFNTDYIRDSKPERLLELFRDYLKQSASIVQKADDVMLARLIKINAGARTLADIEAKSRFIFVNDDSIEYDQKAVDKVLLKDDGLSMLKIVRQRLGEMTELTHDRIEQMLRQLAEEKAVGLGKVAQPLRVAICGSTISPPIFDSVDILGKERVFSRIDATLAKFGGA